MQRGEIQDRYQAAYEAMRRIFEALPGLAASRAPLLISGTRGSGRAALAEIVHALSSLGQARPLVTLRCDAPPPTPLMGPGGPLDRARGGTLVLENLCQAPLPLQQRLLNWLEHGGERDEPRLISTATDRLRQRLREGSFREDLFYRLNVLQVALPDLRG
jgi:DNA-binding NtrC family response regulator